MPSFDDLNTFVQPWPLVIAGSIFSAIIILLLRFFVLSRILKWTERTRFTLDSLLVHAISVPLTLFSIAALIAIIEFLLNYHKLIPETPNSYTASVTTIISIIAIVLFIDRFILGLLGRYADASETFKNSKSIVQGISRGLIFCIGILVLMGTLGISITPIIASLGITSLAVALALQPTLENFFSGVQLVIDKPIRVADFIELESGEQGFVEKIGWRSTWIRMLPNNTIIVPNSDLSKSRIINYFYPEKELSVPVDVGVHYNSDLEHVEKVTLEVAREILISHEWGVDDYNTFVIFHTFDSSSINFTVMLRAKEYFNRFWVKSAFIKALHKRYAAEGIVIPYPIRAINTEQEAAQVLTNPDSDTSRQSS